MNWNWQVIFESLPNLTQAALLTIELVVLSCLLGLILGVALGILRASKHMLISFLPFLYIFFFRGTPLLVQIFLIYYGLGQFTVVKESFLWKPVLSEPYWCASSPLH